MTAPTARSAPAPPTPDPGVGQAADVLRPRRRRRWLRPVLALLVVLVAAGVVWAVWFSPWLTVQQVRVLGVEEARADAVIAAAAVPVGVQLARVDAARSEEAVLDLPWVAGVEVRRGWPSEVVVAVVARTPVAVLDAGAGSRSAVDAEGVVFDVPGPLARDLPTVEASGVALTEAMAVLDSLPPDLARRVVAVVATTRDDVTLRLRSGDLVRWGSSGQAEFKAEVLRALMNRKAEVYDVSAPELPTTFRPRS